MTSVTVATLMTSSKEDVVSVLGGIYEHSPWVAEAFYTSHVDGTTADSNAIENVRQLFDILSSIVDAATREQKLQLLRAHPDLAAKVEKLKTLTKESQEEQSKAGLDTLTDEERVRFLSLNESYRVKFGFPFILAVRNATKYTVISAVEGRISNTPEEEFVSALGQVHKIAWMRLLGAIDYPNPAGFLTCHVLDTANGCPADNMRSMGVCLEALRSRAQTFKLECMNGRFMSVITLPGRIPPQLVHHSWMKYPYVLASTIPLNTTMCHSSSVPGAFLHTEEVELS
eukprot:CAMPEP_0178508670 /NCGR_PEP_ID=MMETSP0696-20121128/20881_1 /TAXON_ID=265572 /ORGANISM="Extubocellulus spinifer, Strain CCMP396" /LENGTH=284 /DNA_ID=CAMNT_0020138249 /DNA_START=53 /DNA_END=907 /DNA_ORIENTATION=-